MKAFFFTFLLAVFIVPIVSAQHNSSQNGTAKSSPLLDKVIPPAQLSGNNNYMLSLNKKDFTDQSYVFYTDSNATVAHISINGNKLRLMGGLNAENSMSYSCKGYTIMLNNTKKSAAPEGNNDGTYSPVGIETSLVIYTNSTVIIKKVTGIEIKQNGK